MQNRYRLYLAAIAMAVFMLAIAAAGASGISDAADPTNGTCGDHLVWTYTESTQTLEIKFTGNPGDDGGMADYQFTSPPWAGFREKIETLIIGDGVTSISYGAFQGCSGLTGALAIPASVKYIYDRAFLGCSGLTGTLAIPASVTHIGDRAFLGCSGLTGTLAIPASVKYIYDRAFLGCSGLIGKITIPSSVTYIGYGAFGGCSITEFAVDGNDRFVVDQGILYDKDMTTLLQCPGGKTGEIKIPASVTNIGDNAFHGCSGLTGTLTIPGSVRNIDDYAFQGCSGLTGLTFSETSALTTIGDHAFHDCWHLDGALTIPGSVTYIGDHAFQGCSDLDGALTIPGSVTYIGDNAFDDCYNLTGLTFSETSALTTIGDHAFHGCSGLKCDLTIPNSVITIGRYAFSSCYNLTGTLAIPGSVTYIGNYAFVDCYNLTGLTFSETSALTTIGDNAFYGCSKLKGDLTIPDSVTSVDRTVFYGCGFDGCLTVPGSLKEIGLGMFNNCKYLKSVVICEGVETIGKESFLGCTSLVSVTVPGSLKEIGDNAFLGLTFLDFVNGDWEKVQHTPDNLKGKAWKGEGKGESGTLLYRSFKVTFDANGGSFGDDTDSKESWTVVEGKLTSVPDDPVKVHYDFRGWLDGSGNGLASKFTADTTYRANYEPKTMYVSFIPNGGTFDPDTFQKDPANDEFRFKEVTYGEPYGDLPEVVREGMHSFWALYDKDKDVWIPIDKDTEVAMEDDHQLTALWRDDEYRVTVTVENGRTDLYEDGEVYNVRYHASLNIPILPDEGYEPPKERSGVSVRIGGAPYDGFSYTVDGSVGQALVSIPKGVIEGPVEVTVGCILRILTVSVDTSDPGIASVEYMIGEGGTFVSYTAPFNVSYGSKLTLRAVVEDGYEFKEWSPGNTDAQLVIGSVTSDIELAPVSEELPDPPVPGPTPKPKPQVITVDVSFKPTTGGRITMDSAKIPLNAKVTVNGDTLIIGSGSSKTIVKAEAFNGFVFDSWSIEDGNILKDGEVTAKFRAITLSGISVESSPAKTEYKEGEKFDPTGLVIIAGFDNMSSTTMGYDGNKGLFTFSPSLDAPLSSDDTIVTVYYNGQSTDVAITVTSDSSDDTVLYVAIGVAVAVALAAVAAFFLIRKP